MHLPVRCRRKTAGIVTRGVMLAVALRIHTMLPAQQSPVRQDPALTIPTSRTPPRIDGKLSPGEWQFAAAITGFEAYNAGAGMRSEQPVFYVFRDKQNLYIAMDSIESNTNTVVAACVKHDHLSIIGDDCMEFMVAPGTKEDANRFDFPTFYIAANSLGTVWDARFVPLSAEVHNSWESGTQVASAVEGTRWTCEMRLPLASVSRELPKDDQTWRMNFDRTYYGYLWSAWKPGALNDARTGGNVRFDSEAPAVRLLSVDPLLNGKLNVSMEVANATSKTQTVNLRLHCDGERELGKGRVTVGEDEKEVIVAPGEVKLAALGRGQTLLSFNGLTLEAAGSDGKPLLFMARTLNLPAPRFEKKPAPEVKLVYVFPRFLPSLERLAVLVDYNAWAKKTGYTGPSPTADIRVRRKGQEGGKPVLDGTLKQFERNKGTWRVSTAKLAEGEYSVKVRVTVGAQVIADEDDWFEKRVFDWMVHKRGISKDVPAPYTPVQVVGDEVRVWGRAYRFGPTGLPSQVLSQGKPLLAAPVKLTAEAKGKMLPLTVGKPAFFSSDGPGAAKGKSSLTAGNLALVLESQTEYDGFALFRLTYGPMKGTAQLDRMRLRVPLTAQYAKFYSAAGDSQGVQILGEVLPDKQGKILDSLNDLRSVCCSPTFASLFWVGDYETCFCYAGDSDKGWLLRDDAPGLEVVRKGETLEVWLNFVDRPVTLSKPRTLEFGLQAGPTKPLPEGWRGVQQEGIVGDCPLAVIQVGGDGHTMSGGTHILHPGDTPELQRRSRERLEQIIAGGSKAVVGYHYWGTVPKGRPETRVFRAEWGIDRRTWDAATEVRKWEWENRFHGENKDLYIIMGVNPVPSYVDFITYGYDEALKHTPLAGFYDDTGYPKPVFDPELGLGYIRDDGKEVYSSGLWIYRDRWKRAAYLNAKHGRPNFLGDSQHCGAHYMPAYGFIGCWAPCEHGYYNPFPDRDNLGFYGSMERYVAFNPARQFGQIPNMIGMSTPQWEVPLAARDTRCMMMLAMLNDQDVGSFGARDLRIVCQLRHARNLFKPWEKDVEFLGYWRSKEALRWDAADVLVSVYRSPRGALFVLGNTGKATASVTVEPDWKRLGLALGTLKGHDAEGRGEVPFGANGGFKVEVPSHDVRIVLVSPPSSHEVLSERPGEELPSPKTIVKELSDTFEGPGLSPVWQRDLHEGHASVGILDGRLYIQGAHYGYAHLRREFGLDNVSVQCLIARAGSGCSDPWGASVILTWRNGEYVQATPGTSDGKFLYLVSRAGTFKGQAVSTHPVPGWYPNYLNWVKVVLKPDVFEFHSSADGKTWVKDQVVKRDPRHAGPPQWLLLGNGGPGDRPHFDNALSQHFNPEWPECTLFADLVVGREG